jgi:flagellar hook-associated protein 3 FlgL
MSMRISTATMNDLAVAAMLRQQAALAKIQNQVATGKRVQSPADDPVAAAQLYALTRVQSQLDQYGNNSTALTGRLQLEEQAVADASTVLQRVRELALQANTATVSNSDRQDIATELKSRIEELQSIANRKDANGDYLFAGYAATTQPFARDASGQMIYSGDAGVRQVQIDDSRFIADSDPGSAVFGDVPAGNGKFTTAAAPSNTGSGVLDVGSVTNPAQWVPDSYTISFPTTATWQVTDGAGNVVGSGSYVSGGAIAFRGVQVTVAGAPAVGDAFTLSPAGTQDMFATLDSLVATLGSSVSSDATRAQLTTALTASLQQIDQASQHLSTVRATIGARLANASDADAARQNQSTALATTVSGLQDLDYASAVSKLNQQYVSLQAAQQSYAAIAKLSLFNFL